MFAERGYAGVSVRAVAERAGVDPALVHHYFGTKERLFRAVLRVPVDPDQLVADIVAVGAEDAPAHLVRTFLTVWDGPETGPAMVAFFRTILAEPSSTELVRNFVGAAVLRRTAEGLLGHDDPAADTRVGLVLSQMLGLVLLRAVLGVEPVASMPPDRLAAAVAPTIARYLHGDLEAPTDSHVIDPAQPTVDHNAPGEGTP